MASHGRMSLIAQEDRLSRFQSSLRILRLANSLLFGVLCVACIAWWARSYWYADNGYISTIHGEHTAFSSGYGRMCVWFEHSAAKDWFNLHCRPLTEPRDPNSENRIPIVDLKAFWPTMTRLYVAHWFLAVATGLIALAPWLPRQISVRGMMIAAMAVAFLIAIISWIDHTF